MSRITPEELNERGWEGPSPCRCLTVDGDAEPAYYAPCPPMLCEADRLVQENNLLRDRIQHLEIQLAGCSSAYRSLAEPGIR